MIDTPGLLDRPLSERNAVEKQAVLALKHLAKAIVFVFDPSLACGYSIESQLNLYKEIGKEFTVGKIPVINKADIIDKKTIAEIESELGAKAIVISAKESTGISELKSKIYSLLGL
jgi:nucleolar GTP-binding protein